VIEMNSKSKMNPELTEMLNDGFNEILMSSSNRSRIIAHKLAMHEIVRNGFGNQRGNFMRFVNSDLFLKLNEYITGLHSKLENMDEFHEYVGTVADKEVMMLQVYHKLIRAAVYSKGSKIKGLKNIRIEKEDIAQAESIFFPEGGEIKPPSKDYLSERAISTIIEKDYENNIAKKQSLRIDMSHKKGENSKAKDSIASILGLQLDNAQESTYVFPVMYKNETGGILVLTQLRKDDDVFSYLEPIEVLLSKDEHNRGVFAGVEATYELMEFPDVGDLNLSAFSMEEINEFHEYISGTKRIPENETAPLPENTTGEELVQNALDNKSAEPKC